MNPAWVFGAAGLVFTLVTYAIGWGVFRQKVEELRTQSAELKARLAKCEADMGAIAEVKTAVAVLSAEFRGWQAIYDRDGRETRHDIAQMRQGLEGVLKELRDRRAS